MLKIERVGNIYTKYLVNLVNSELALIRWNPKVKTPIHNHGGKNCDFYLLGGSIHEVKYRGESIGTLTTSEQLTSFKKNTVKKSKYHQIFNFDNAEKWSIHYYY